METHTPEPTYKQTYNGLFPFKSKAQTLGLGRSGEHIIPSMCQLQIFKKNEIDAVVLATEIYENPGMSVTNAFDYLAEQVAAHFQLLPERTIFVEHYTPDSYRDHRGEETYDLVTLTWEGLEVTNVGWRRVSKADFEKLLNS